MQTRASVKPRTTQQRLFIVSSNRLAHLFSITPFLKHFLKLIIFPQHLLAHLLTHNEQDDSLPQMPERQINPSQPESFRRSSIEPPSSDRLTEAHSYFKHLFEQGAHAFFAASDTPEYQRHFHTVLKSLSIEERKSVQRQADIADQQFQENLDQGMSLQDAILANTELAYSFYLFTGERPPK